MTVPSRYDIVAMLFSLSLSSVSQILQDVFCLVVYGSQRPHCIVIPNEDDRLDYLNMSFLLHYYKPCFQSIFSSSTAMAKGYPDHSHRPEQEVDDGQSNHHSNANKHYRSLLRLPRSRSRSGYWITFLRMWLRLYDVLTSTHSHTLPR